MAYHIRQPTPADFSAMQDLCRRVYPFSPPWNTEQLQTHLRLFAEGQFIAVESDGRVGGMAFSLIVSWDDYSMQDSWRNFTDGGHFTNHDPENGRTLYGAEVMVDPELQGQGIGSQLYQARQALVERKGLLRIRAGARLHGYSAYSSTLTPEQYLYAVVSQEIFDATLSFQLKQGFQVLALVPEYLKNDPESMGNAAVIEWLNPAVATPEHYRLQEEHFAKAFAGMANRPL